MWLDNKVKEHVKELEDMKQMKIMAPDDEDLSKPEGKEMQPHESRERKNKSYTKEKKHTKLNTVNVSSPCEYVCKYMYVCMYVHTGICMYVYVCM